MDKQIRLAFISRHPAPYRDEFLSRLLVDRRILTEVFSELPQDKGHAFWNLKTPQYSVELLRNDGLSEFGFIWKCLKKFVFGKYDFIMWPAYVPRSIFWLMLFSALIGKHFGFPADTIKQNGSNRFWIAIKRWVFRRCSIISVPGEAGVRFFMQEYGVERKCLCTGAYALDGKGLENEILTLRERRTALRLEFGVPEDATVFLMVANMIPTRHYPITSVAFSEFAKVQKSVVFVMVGNGPDYEKMQDLAKNDPHLKVVAGCAFDEMKKWYAIADVYVHGGTEPASTALIIGAIAHLPLISSGAVGCSADCLVDEKSGIRVGDYLSMEEWKMAFGRIMKMRDRWSTMGASARVLSQKLDVEETCNNFVNKLVECCR